jgi:hypothetical protein
MSEGRHGHSSGPHNETEGQQQRPRVLDVSHGAGSTSIAGDRDPRLYIVRNDTGHDGPLGHDTGNREFPVNSDDTTIEEAPRAQALAMRAGAKKKAGRKAAPKKAGRKAATKKAAPKRAVAKKAGRKAAPKKTARKAAPKKAGRKVAAKKAGRKAAPKKTGRKVAAKKAAPKRAVAKKAGRKAAVKKTARKTAAPKKAPRKISRPRKKAAASMMPEPEMSDTADQTDE